MLMRVLLTMLSILTGSALLPASAQESFILVIDGSSSMWGQVDGRTKIEILKSSLSNVLGQLATDAVRRAPAPTATNGCRRSLSTRN